MKQESNSALGLPPSLKDREFKRFSAVIYEEVGIKMPPAKKTMLEARLQKRLKALGIRTFEEYADYFFSPPGRQNELVHLIDVVTTNKTDFFREPAHFEFLTSKALPQLIKDRNTGFKAPLKIWSAGCSTGEEPYTLAMVLAEYAASNPGFRFNILASDICTEVLAKSRNAIYLEERTDPIPLNLKKKYLLKSRDKTKSLVRVVPELRSMIKFMRINFMEDFPLTEQMEIIFCRNVIIYFDKQTQSQLMTRFWNQLVPGGYLFLGHSETLNGLNVPFTPVISTVYRKI